MASVPTLLFLALCLSIGSLSHLDTLMTFADQHPQNSLIPIAVYAFLFFLLPFTFFSATVLLLSHVTVPRSAHTPLPRAFIYLSSRTEHILKSMASLQKFLFLGLSVSISGLLFESLLPSADESTDTYLISAGVHTFLYFLLSLSFFSSVTLLILRVAVSPN